MEANVSSLSRTAFACVLLVAGHAFARAAASNGSGSDADAPQVIELDGHGTGRVFEGIGGLSAGAASRLLIDYPEPQRSQILDFLFKPNVGAALQHLKVEIGGTINSTWGAEPSHAITRDEMVNPRREYHERGYEWWLMKEARKRNPAILLESLQWGAPGWIGGGEYFSQDNADYVVAFHKGARAYHGLTIQYQGIRNEAGYKIDWIKTLRKTLDAAGLRDVKLTAADDPGDVQWKIVKDMLADPELMDAVYAAGVHYVPYTSTDEARKTGKPLWFSEAAIYGEPWGRAKNFARLYNRNYIVGRMTKTIVCTPITSLLEHLVPFNVEIWNNPGLMKANTPWSGHYEVPPAVWATAHTTQFAQPGWQYIDSACGFLANAGSYVTLKSAHGGDYSVIIETLNNLPYEQACQNTHSKDDDAEVQPARVTFKVKNLSVGPVHVWRSRRSAQFEQLPDITPKDDSFAITLTGNSIYTLTTTSGQQKGSYEIPEDRPFPFPYADDFESTPPGKTPRYLSDQEGSFAVAVREDGRGKCLRQIVPQKGIPWFVSVESPWTFVGDKAWADYQISVDARIPDKQFAAVYGRIDAPMSRFVPGGYGLKLDSTGAWQLMDTLAVLASGKVNVQPGSWHNLMLVFSGARVIGAIDGKTVCDVMDDFHPTGAVALAGSYAPVEFDNLAVTALKGSPPGSADKLENLALGKKITASSEAGAENIAAKATDGRHDTGWCPAPGKTAGEWLEVDFGQEVSFDRTVVDQHTISFGYAGGIGGYKIQYWDGTAWKDAVVRTAMAIRQTDDFAAVTATKVRLLIAGSADKTCVYEFKAYRRRP